MTARSFWLFKSEPDCYSFDDLMDEPDGQGHWDGVRNYQARNYLRDRMSIGDGVLFYHSSCPEPGIVGTAKVASEAYADYTQFDPKSEGFDPKSKQDDPRWWMVDVSADEKFPTTITLVHMREIAELEKMVVLRRGNRLSITPVTKKEWDAVLRVAKSRR